MKKELLCPAGSMESLKAAINGGCDAVYAGMKEFGARKFANNFSREEIIEAIKLCHLYGVKIYITLNTLVKDNEVDSFMELVDFLYNYGVDALLIQDFGMMNLVLNTYPDMEVHASTHFNNSSLATIKLLKDMGVKRVVLSREMNIDEINAIDIDIEKEVFIHGALCISYSGNCLFSSMLGNRSGNRGECTGCCRLPYKLYEEDNFIKSGYLLSTKELNSSRVFDKLLNSDIKSFKIEGRMKSPEYVYFITRFYRNIIDGKGYSEDDLDTLKILFNREFTTGNLFNDEIMNTKSPNHIGLKIGKVVKIDHDRIYLKLDRVLHQEDGIRFLNSKKGMIVNFLYNNNDLLTSECDGLCAVKNNIDLQELDDVYLTSSKYLSNSLLNYDLRKVPISFKFSAVVGDKVSLTVSDYENSITVSGDVCQEAKTNPVSKERIKEQLQKLGNTIYELKDFECNISNNLFIPMGFINNLRRDAIEKLNEKRIFFKKVGKNKINFAKLDINNTIYKTLIVNKDDDISNSSNYKRLYTSDCELFDKYKNSKNIYYIEKRNVFDGEIGEKSLVFEYRYPKDSISDYSFNVTNIYSVYYLLKLGFKCVTLSVELSEVEVCSLINNFYKKFAFYPNVEVLCLDRVELMVIKGNILDISKDKKYYLKDFKEREFPVYFDGVNTHVFNYELRNFKSSFNCNMRYNYKYLK